MEKHKTSIEIGNYKINLYHEDNNRDVVVVFASAGITGLGEPIEEFKNSLSKFGRSMIFIMEKAPTWFNSPKTEDMFVKVSDLCNAYENIAVLGESMGASGSIIFSKYNKNINRILAIAPQYSVSNEFIEYDWRFNYAGNYFTKQNFYKFACKEAKNKTQILFGDSDWLDLVHAGMFSLEGFSITYVSGTNHFVPAYLKKNSNINHLHILLENFLDFSKDFSKDSVIKSIGNYYTSNPIGEKGDLKNVRNQRFKENNEELKNKILQAPHGYTDLAYGKLTNQSSASQWSGSIFSLIDSMRVVGDNFFHPYGFHTEREENPWWSIELGHNSLVKEIRIYNRIDNEEMKERGSNFSIEQYSEEDNKWIEFYKKNDNIPFGGIDGNPFILIMDEPILINKLRIRLLSFNYMHFQRIEIFGNEICL
ncbi:discoidin domain-containing protein [Gluconobacter roseus]|uniref:F5/8 type C domain-containing protein n=1 Tax=Gluconobacter roseus NBRC 3990 TaxID=1307950 RepID=A0A4Y3MB14_9PROT|nr:discoidin domain-containing protein [Gluconobacter roseus]GBR43498.1 hypothetical protein AA3990_0443 [Gluconobacter roseus NBRC 3990]GEB05086.1 hypothetical protein GRO01_26620 [Gluconobacter roseus NBRC 3990]GLP94693.1 hypothetical protein GCM10007871_26710 [Gluconobacter roseus NBRC 3990]